MKKYEMKVCDGRHPRIEVTEEFVSKNNLMLNRTEEEKKQYAEKNDDSLGFVKEILVSYMDPENTLEWIKEEYKEKHLKLRNKILDVYECTQDFLDYMVFGWMKALDERGISASRTIEKCATYMWLLGRDDIEQVLRDDSLYNPYGSPALIKACEMLGIQVPPELIEFSKHKC